MNAGTCARCGVFLCDWCVALSPSWAPSTCQRCLSYREPRRPWLRPFSFGTGFTIALLASMTVFQAGALLQAPSVARACAALVFAAATALVLWSQRTR